MQRGVAVVGAVAVVLGVAAAVLSLAAPPPNFRVLAPTAAVAFGATGALVALRGRATAAALVLAIIGLLFGVSGVARTYGVLATTRDLPLVVPAVWIGAWLFAPAVVTAATVLPLVLPEGRLPSPRWRPALGLAVLGVLTTAASWALIPYELQDFPASRVVANPVGVAAMAEPAAQLACTVPAVAALLVSLSSLVVRWRRAAPDERQQLKWLALGIVAAVVVWGVSQLVASNNEWFAVGFALPVPVCCAVAALRHRLWDVDLVISRTLVAGVLTALVLSVSAVLVGLLGGLLGLGAAGPVLAAAAAVLVVLPLHGRVRRLVNHLVHGDADDPATALTRLGGRLEATAGGTERVLREVVARLGDLLHSPYAALRLADGEIVETGERPAEVDVVALRQHGVDVGALVLAARARTGAERARLELLASQAAVAVHTVLLARDLRRTRQLAVTAREEERRRLRRDLHDGLGPVIAALGLQAETARDLLPSDPPAAAALLDRMVPLLAGTVSDVRTLVHDLRPPTLDELGLEGAVRELAARFGGPDLTIGCEIGQLGSLPAAVDVAAYRIVAEAIANASRHAGAHLVRVEVRRDDTWLHVAVRDDGRGINGTPGPGGLGLASMRQRAAELDGRCELAIKPGPAGRWRRA